MCARVARHWSVRVLWPWCWSVRRWCRRGNGWAVLVQLGASSASVCVCAWCCHCVCIYMVLLLCVCMLVRVWERLARDPGEGLSVGGVGVVSAGRCLFNLGPALRPCACVPGAVIVCAYTWCVAGPRSVCVCVRVRVCVSMVRVSAVCGRACACACACRWSASPVVLAFSCHSPAYPYRGW